MFGTITFFHRSRGFGFVRTSPTAEDVFFHCREFDGDEEQLVRGAKIEFEFGINKGRQVARNIRLAVETEVATDTKDGAR